MSAILIVTWQVAPDAIDEYWDFIKGEQALLERHGARPIRYFRNLGSGLENLDSAADDEKRDSAAPIVVSISLEYEDIDAWRAGHRQLNVDPEYQAHVARWNERRSDLLVGETRTVLFSEVDIDQVGFERRF